MKNLILGPIALSTNISKLIGIITTIFLTLFTQVGGLIIWPFWHWALGDTSQIEDKSFSTLKSIGKLFGIYFFVSLLVVPLIANQTGRQRLPLYATTELPLGPQTILFPLLNRTYVRHHAHRTFVNAVQNAVKQEPDMVVRYLDAGFPFPFIPLLPHLSHSDGQRIDVAFQFEQEGDYVDRARSPIGYWGYAQESKERCVDHNNKYPILLRWDFKWLQPLLPDLDLDITKNKTLFTALAKDKQVCTILLEPTLHKALEAPKLLGNSCDVARHDDHFHVTIKQVCHK